MRTGFRKGAAEVNVGKGRDREGFFGFARDPDDSIGARRPFPVPPQFGAEFFLGSSENGDSIGPDVDETVARCGPYLHQSTRDRFLYVDCTPRRSMRGSTNRSAHDA